MPIWGVPVMPFTAGGPRVGGDDLGNVMVLLKQSVCILFYQAMKEEPPPPQKK